MDNCPSCLMLKEASGDFKKDLANPIYCRACYQRERAKVERLQAALQQANEEIKRQTAIEFEKSHLEAMRRLKKVSRLRHKIEQLKHKIDQLQAALQQANEEIAAIETHIRILLDDKTNSQEI